MDDQITLRSVAQQRRGRKDEWPQARIDRMLDLLLAQKKSYQQIADDLGVTRNAVAGMVNTLRVRRRRAIHARPVAKPKRARSGATPKSDDRACISHGLIEPASKAKPDPERFSILIAEEGRKRCRWPLEGEGMEMVCCGAPVASAGADTMAGSYCAFHFHKSQRQK